MEQIQVQPGDVIAGKYRVEKVLGAGGMGVVLAAQHATLGNRVAIKLMQPHAVTVRGATERFLREGQAAAQLVSPHVAKVLDLGQTEAGAPYMIMELLSGGDLAALVEKKGPCSLSDATEYLLQACDAIGEAHAKGIVHRDLKPANLFLIVEPDGTPCVKVLDFGIAKMKSAGEGITRTSQGMGSGGYMSPEQMSSAKQVDQRADIWALGVTYYELLSGKRPFEAESLEQFVTRVFWEEPTPLSTHRRDLPLTLEYVLGKCLAKQPDQRFPTVAHFAAAIAPFAPQRAQVYVERIAKTLGIDPSTLSSGAAAQPAAAPAPPPAQGMSPGTAPLPPGAVSGPGPMRLTPVPGSGPMGGPPSGLGGGIAASAPVVGAVTAGQGPITGSHAARGGTEIGTGPAPGALVGQMSQATDLTGAQIIVPAPAKTPLLLYVLSAVGLVAIGALVVVVLMRPSGDGGGAGSAQIPLPVAPTTVPTVIASTTAVSGSGDQVPSAAPEPPPTGSASASAKSIGSGKAPPKTAPTSSAKEDSAFGKTRHL